MDHQSSYTSSSITIELKLIKARNIEPKSPSQELFVRCYLPNGSNNGRSRIDSQVIPSQSKFPTWDQTFSLCCSGTRESIKSLEREVVVFELRCRTRVPTCIGCMIKKGSKLVGRAERPWKDIVEAGEIGREEWVVMIPKNGWIDCGDVKPPAVKMAIKVKELIQENKKGIHEIRLDGSCGCKSCMAYEFVVIEAALEALF
ncbi:uncharacterized protein LOC127260352 [Andrographis paniculata]|uniref:uncharacterized protein LOC127260352 n=1 Tax=Andrographis paniculata TaxID=175694 RepID=UPI0021E88C65|nr:uncharacterized protein LOC127260352 [Andrographis paniculata]